MYIIQKGKYSQYSYAMYNVHSYSKITTTGVHRSLN